MLKQLLCSLQQFARRKEREVKKGFYTSEFAASLIQSYTNSMIKALIIINRASYIRKIRSEADKHCLAIYSDYQPTFKLPHRRKKAKSTRMDTVSHQFVKHKSMTSDARL